MRVPALTSNYDCQTQILDWYPLDPVFWYKKTLSNARYRYTGQDLDGDATGKLKTGIRIGCISIQYHWYTPQLLQKINTVINTDKDCINTYFLAVLNENQKYPVKMKPNETISYQLRISLFAVAGRPAAQNYLLS